MSMELFLAGVAGLALVATTFSRPTRGLSLWLMIVVFTPSWTVFYALGFSLTPFYAALPVLLAVLLSSNRDRFVLNWIDWAFFAGVALVLGCHFWFGQESFLWTNAVFALAIPYALGRLASPAVLRVLATVLVLVACWGLVEFAFGWHAFTGWQADVGGLGAALQERGGFTRSEASLGHAIAYGAALALALPLASFLRQPGLAQVALSAGVVVAFSRGPLVAVVFTLAMMFFVRSTAKNRIRSALLFAGGLVVAYVVFSFLYSGSAEEDVRASGDQRNVQIARAVGAVNLLGPADGTVLSSEGRYVTNGIEIVDSTPLRFALDFGWITMVLLLVPILLSLLLVLRRRAGPAAVSVAGQVPVLLVTSLITQWQSLLFFVAGAAVAEFARAQAAGQSEPGSGRLLRLPRIESTR